MKRNLHPTVLVFAVTTLCGANLHASTVIYEPFADADSTLNGNTPGTGHTGTWSAATGSSTYPITVGSGTATYGNLGTSGNRVYMGANPAGNQVNSNASVSTGTSLNGLMDDGDTLWFSFLYTVPDTVSINSNFGFAIGTGALSNTATLGAGNTAVGVTIGRNNRAFATSWTNGVTNGSNATTTAPGFSAGATQLIVGKIEWGASSETISIYLPGSDLALPTTGGPLNDGVWSTVTTPGNIDQAAAGFNILSFGGKNATATPQGIDEIRFGSTYAAVVPVPEPRAALLGGFGLLALLRRRR